MQPGLLDREPEGVLARSSLALDCCIGSRLVIGTQKKVRVGVRPYHSMLVFPFWRANTKCMCISEFRGDFQYLQPGSSTCLGKSLGELHSACCSVEAQTVTLSSRNIAVIHREKKKNFLFSSVKMEM